MSVADTLRSPRPAAPRTTMVGGRYALRERLGTGTSGSVWSAEDTFTGASVAVKLGTSSFHEEAALLRLLKLPGVVRFLDVGEDEGLAWLVMERIHGERFPTDRSTWGSLAHIAMGLLEALARLHAAGITHGDIKPANVLITQGVVTLVDLGNATPGTVEGEPIQGTPLYAAPELLERGELSAAGDVYAAALVIAGALAGSVPAAGLTIDAIRTARERRLAPFETSLAPPEVRRTLLEMLDPQPNARPAATEAARRLASAAPPVAPAITDEDPYQIFAGPERVLHLRSEGARLLLSRAGANRAGWGEELDRWWRIGAIRWSQGRAHLNATAISDLEPPVAFPSASAAFVEARQRLERGDIAAARPILSYAAVIALRQHLDTRALARAITVAALADGSPSALREARAELGRLRGAESCIALIDAVIASEAGRHAAALSVLPPIDLEDDELRAAHEIVRVRHAVGTGANDVEDLLDALDATPASPALQSRRLSLRGLLRYRQGRFLEAAALHRSSRALWAVGDRGLASLLNEGSALLDALKPHDAIEVAQEALDRAQQGRWPVFEAHAERLLRAATYRAGENDPPDHPLIAAVEELGNLQVLASTLLGECARAWRLRDPSGPNLASRCVEVAQRTGMEGIAVLATAITVSLTGDREVADALRPRILQLPLPRVAGQALALAGLRDENVVTRLRLDSAYHTPAIRLEVLSTSECLERLVD